MGLVPPKWTVEPEDTNVVMGHPCMLNCQAEGYPTPTVVWRKSFGILHCLSILINFDLSWLVNSSYINLL